MTVKELHQQWDESYAKAKKEHPEWFWQLTEEEQKELSKLLCEKEWYQKYWAIAICKVMEKYGDIPKIEDYENSPYVKEAMETIKNMYKEEQDEK